jgi:uroporphyrinogen-III synthase
MSDPERPLAGRRVVVTRSSRQAGALASRLEALGAVVVQVPAIEVAAPPDAGPLDRALAALDRYDWLAFTSANAVEAVKARLFVLGLSLPPTLKLASVGSATTEAIGTAFPGSSVRLEPADDYRAEGLLRAFGDLDPRPRHVLLPVSDRARTELAEGLRKLGVLVENPMAYCTLAPPDLGPSLETALAAGVDLVLFASPSAVQGLADVLGSRTAGLRVVTIGPTTAQAARAAGFTVAGVASPSTTEGLVGAAVQALAARARSEPSP